MTDVTKPSYMSDFEFEIFKNEIMIHDQGYAIQPKRDFGPYGYRIVTQHDDGTHTVDMVKVGWIVCKDGVLATPGASWAKTIDEARRLVAALKICESLGLKNCTSEYNTVFWNLLKL